MRRDTTEVDSESLKVLIETSWAHAPYPGDEHIVAGHDYESLEVAAFFAGRHWAKLSLSTLSQEYSGDHSACLALMTPEGFRYYLPVYMFIALDHHESGDLASEIAVAALAPPDLPGLRSYFDKRVKAVMPHRDAIIEFLLYLSIHHPSGGIVDPCEALAFWRGAA